jgi:hypothetical protein
VSPAAWVLGAHLLSIHVPGTHEFGAYRTVTPGLYAIATSGATFGAYRNSYGRVSAYGGWTWRSDDGRLAFVAAGATGYEGPAIRLIAAPSVRFSLGSTWLRVAYLPRVEKSGAHVIHLAIERPLP